MAINPSVEYVGKITAPTPAYPRGSAVNVTAPGAGDGTPLEQKWLNDKFGFEQSLLAGLAVAPNNVPEQVGNSQYYQAIIALASGLANVLTDGGAADVYTLTPPTDVQTPPVLFDGYAVRFTPANDNTGASTVQMAALGVKAIVDYLGNPLTGGELRTIQESTLVYNLANDNFILSETFKGSRRQIFTVSGNYTPTPGTRSIIVEAQAGGGGGGGVVNPGNGFGNAGGGGGGGEYRAGEFSIGALTLPVAFTIGASGAGGSNSGGDGGNGGGTTFDTIAATGGVGGIGWTGVGVNFVDRGESPGAGGSGGSGGDISIPGEGGSFGTILAIRTLGGGGGNAQLGHGAIRIQNNIAGVAGSQYGGGGGSASRYNNTGGASTRLGGAGADGVLIITEFF